MGVDEAGDLGGGDGWTPEAIRRLLVNPAFIGLFVWGRTRRERDESDKIQLVPTKWTEWGIYYDPSLALIPKAWHVAMRKRYEKSRGPRGSKPQAKRSKMATTLFDSTLVCDYCGHEHYVAMGR